MNSLTSSATLGTPEAATNGQPRQCRECQTAHEPCVCERCHGGPPPLDPWCERCDHHHVAGDSHCPNCGQPASSGFHACWNLDDCPEWVAGVGWVLAERAAS